MPKGRMLLRSISTSRRIEKMSDWAQVLFDRIVIFTDDFGRIEGEAHYLKAEVKPLANHTPEDFAAAVAEMVTVGALVAYVPPDGDRPYLLVPKHDEHQSGLHKRTKSRLPDPTSCRKLTADEYLTIAVADSVPVIARTPDVPPPAITPTYDATPAAEPKEEKKQRKSREKTPRTKMTPEWRPSPEVIEEMQAECPAVDVARAIPEFRDYWIGNGELKANWDATFRNRIRTLNDRAQQRSGNQRHTNGTTAGRDLGRAAASDQPGSAAARGQLGRFKPRQA